jgi:short-subunit dehydrogenase
MEQKKVVAITGGCGRIGSALAKDLIDNNYRVLLGYVNKSKLLNFKKIINTDDLEIFPTDLTKKKNKLSQEMKSEVVKDFFAAFPGAKLTDVSEDDDA